MGNATQSKTGDFSGNTAANHMRESASMGQQSDKENQSRSTKKMAVLFTDVQGSSAFFKTHGDIAGRVMLQKHNDLLFPIIKKNGGVIIKTIGDSIMASFDDLKMAVHSAVQMQERLLRHNWSMSKKNQIHVRIGINFGDIILEENDIFGNVVNMTSRILSISKPDHIFVSEHIYRMLKEANAFSFRRVNAVVGLKEAQKISVYEVIWRDTVQENKSVSVMSLTALQKGDEKDQDEDSVNKWAESCFDLVIPIIYEQTNRLAAKSRVELISVFEDPITPVEVAREVLQTVRQHNTGKNADEAIQFQVFINTEDKKRVDAKEAGIENAASVKDGFADVIQPNEVYVTARTYDLIRNLDQIEGESAALTREGRTSLYRIEWKAPQKEQKEKLLRLRKELGHGKSPPCFYCSSRRHSVGDCPSKTIWESPNGLRELGNFSFKDINALIAEHINAITRPYTPTESDEHINRKSGRSDMIFNAFYEISNPFQLHFLRRIWLSSATRWNTFEKEPKNRKGGGQLWNGLDCIRVSRLDQAETLLRDEEQKYPKDFRVHTAFGFLAVEKGNFTGALSRFANAMICARSILQKSYISLLASRIYEVNNRLDGARQKVEEALEMTPDWLEAMYRKAVLMIKMGEYYPGMEELKRIIRKEPNFYVRVLLDPDLAVIEDQVESFLRELFGEAQNKAAENKSKSEEAVEKIKEWFGVTDEKYTSTQADMEKITAHEESNSYIGYIDAASLEDHIFSRSEMILKNHRKRVKRNLSVLISSIEGNIDYIKNHPCRKKLGKLDFSLERVADEVFAAKSNVAFVGTSEACKEAQNIIEHLSACSREIDPVIKRLIKLEKMEILFIALRKVSFFVMGGLIVGSVLFPLTTYYISYFSSDFELVMGRLLDYQVLAIVLSVIVSFVTGLFAVIIKGKEKLVQKGPRRTFMKGHTRR